MQIFHVVNTFTTQSQKYSLIPPLTSREISVKLKVANNFFQMCVVFYCCHNKLSPVYDLTVVQFTRPLGLSWFKVLVSLVFSLDSLGRIRFQDHSGQAVGRL